ncbi:KilA-N domain-containing protein [Flavobacterium hercynium]|uniref:DNA-binding protein n=1 Tax=Flavobacterium hercynium TaxID=387094 RepID=A0A226HDB1_9FLAO|nr:KilA-N domain-containing protein [Flavobacterium hercynium]OXA91656.1 DNA-binding protein [Flavobacterium hercynium]SMP27633.1 KilA-N domain-containing protein [Flavobacterium hercynium]
MIKKSKIIVQDTEISIATIGSEDYICLTDMVSKLDGGNSVIENWLRNKNTIELLGAWEQLYNSDFNSLEFEGIKKEAGLNRFYLSAKKWIETTNAIGIKSKAGRYGGTYAHKDIAFNFGIWISPIFQLYIIKEYQRLKEVESNQYNLEWDVRRLMTKVNYVLHTDAVQKHIIPESSLPLEKQGVEYANEADLLNLALYGYTAKQWKDANPDYAKEGKNMRDFSSINDLLVMSNLESLNSELIKLGTPKSKRFEFLRRTALEQQEKFAKVDIVKSIKKSNPMTYINAGNFTPDEIEAESKKDILEASEKNLLDFNNRKKQMNQKSNDNRDF